MAVLSLGILLFFATPADCASLPSHESAYQESFQACPGNVLLDEAYSSLLIRQGHFARALEVASAGTRFAPSNSTLLLNQGIALYSLRRIKESLDVLASLDSPEAYFYTGLNYRRLIRHTEARSYLLKAWNAGLRDPFLLYSLIEEDHATGEKKAGIEHFQWMLQKYPESAWTHMVLGNAAFALEKDQEARAEYAKALAIDPRLPNVNYRLGFLAYQAGEDEPAEKYFREELKIEPEHSDTWLFLGETLKRRGKTKEAIPYLRHALAMDPASSLHLRRASHGADRDEPVPGGRRHSGAGRATGFRTDPAFPAQLARLYALLHRHDRCGESGRACPVVVGPETSETGYTGQTMIGLLLPLAFAAADTLQFWRAVSKNRTALA